MRDNMTEAEGTSMSVESADFGSFTPSVVVYLFADRAGSSLVSNKPVERRYDTAEEHCRACASIPLLRSKTVTEAGEISAVELFRYPFVPHASAREHPQIQRADRPAQP
jgi:hypothetical protein